MNFKRILSFYTNLLIFQSKTINTHAIAYKETSQSKLILQSFAR